jgi:hypothetical protein
LAGVLAAAANLHLTNMIRSAAIIYTNSYAW